MTRSRMTIFARAPGSRAARFARMAGSTLAAPDAAGWVTDFLNAAYYARPARRPRRRRPAPRARRGHHPLAPPERRLRAHDAIAFHRAFGADRFLRAPRLSLDRAQLLAGAARLLGDDFAAAWADDARRGWGIAFATRRRGRPTTRSGGCATRRSGAHAARAPRARRWSTYPPVPLPSAEAAHRRAVRPRPLARLRLRAGPLHGAALRRPGGADVRDRGRRPSRPAHARVHPRLRHGDRAARRPGRASRRSSAARSSTRPRCPRARRRGSCSS